MTNFRDAERPTGNLLSRGHLVTAFLHGTASPIDFVATIDGERYGGFNLLVADHNQLAYLSNRDSEARNLAPGIYGVANATLDTPWPKVERSKAALAALLARDVINETNLLRMLDDRQKSRVDEVETGDLSFDKAHAMTAPFIVLPDYGTRCSTTVVRETRGSVRMTEKRFAATGETVGQSDFRFSVSDGV